MKWKVMLSVLVISMTTQIQLASAQSAEIQQLILNLEKLSQLKSILSNMKKGYEVVSKGYSTIKDLSEGNYKLHQAFLDGLLAVNPELRRYRKVADIVRYQAEILSEYKSAFTRIRQGGRFTGQELDYLSKVYGNLLKGSLENLDELTMVLTAGELRMSDQERILAIDRLYEDMQGKRRFLRGFNGRALSLDRQREQQLKENMVLRKLQVQ